MVKSNYSTQTVVVIGAGVIGLSCALKLQESLAKRHETRNVEVLLVAREWPTSIPGAPLKHSPNYASMWAGAHVRPIPASTRQLKREAKWLKRTVAEFQQQLVNEPWVGITATAGIEYLDTPGPEYRQQTKESFEAESGLPGFKILSPSEVPEGVQLGYRYSTYCLNAPLYCANLLRKFIVRGGQTLNHDLRTEWEAFSLRKNVKFVVNANGTGFGDPKSFPTRGQTVITNLEGATKTVTRQNKDGTWSFIIPRFFNGGTIMGGTKELGSWQMEPSPDTRQRLLEGGKSLAPHASDSSELSTADLQVIADVVGRRPTRDGGMRIEVEERQLTGSDGELRTGHVLHAYGAGGRGFELSWGIAEEIRDIAESVLPSLLDRRAKM